MSGSPAAVPESPSEPSSRDKILEVAESLFSQRGYAGVGLREVADGVGLGKSSLFHHFPSKAALYEEVLDRVLSRVEAHLAIALRSEGGPVERLEAWTDALIDGLSEHPTAARLALRSVFEDDAAPRRGGAVRAYEVSLGRLVEGFQGLVESGMNAGLFRRVSLGHATQTVIGAAVYHFASGEFGETITGAPLFSAEAIALRRRELKAFLRFGFGPLRDEGGARDD